MSDLNRRDCSIIIPVYNQLRYTRKCLTSIQRHTTMSYEITVVDNGSTNSTPEYLQCVERLRTITNPTNKGYIKACNQGMEVAEGRYVLLLNNDTIVTDGWLEGMMQCAKEDPKIGIVGPMTNYITGPQLDTEANYTSIRQMYRYARKFALRNKGRWMDFPRITGFCMLIKREVIEQVGILDERFGVGNFDDDDYCLRAHLAGFRTVIVGDVFIHHFGSRTFLNSSVDYARLLERNRTLFIEKWHIAPEKWSTLINASQNARISGEPIGIRSDYSAAVFALGTRLLESGRLLDAAKQFRTLLEMKPGFSEARKYLNRCLTELAQVQNIDK